MLRAPFVLLWNVLKLLPFLLKAFFFRLGHFLTRKNRKWVRLKLPPRQAFGPATGLAARFQDKRSFLELREDIDLLCKDPRIEGVVVTADSLTTGAARAADLRALLQRLRAANKKIVFHSYSMMGSDFDLAQEADQVLMTPGGRLYIFGQRFEQYFAAPLLERVGVAAQFVHIGSFKAAAHRFIHDEGTTPLRLMMTQLLENLSEAREQRVLTARNIDVETLHSASNSMPIDDRQALVYGLIDARLQRSLVGSFLEEGDDFVDSPAPTEESADRARKKPEKESRAPVSITSAQNYCDATPAYRWTPLFRRPRTVATLDLSGIIVMAGMELPGHSAATVDPEEVLPALHKLARDRSVGAVVLHINSPGGNALASELIWDGIRRLRLEKPTVAYMSDVAASGGYYMAVAADRIVCQPDTITGSIGVIAGKLSFPGAFEKLGVRSESFQRHEAGLFTSVSEPLSEKILANLQTDARSFYRQFLRRVGEARGLPRRRLHRYARGRVYTGADARRRHLVDLLGGFDDAVALAKSLAQLPEETDLLFQPHRKVSLPALLRKSATSALFPDQARELHLLHTMLKHDPLLALMPFRIDTGDGA